MSLPSFLGNNNTNGTANGGTTTLPSFLQDNDMYCQETNTTTLPAFLRRNSNQTTQTHTILPNFLRRPFLTNSNINDPNKKEKVLLDTYMKRLKADNKRATTSIQLSRNKRKVQNITIMIPRDILPEEIWENRKGKQSKMNINIFLTNINVLITDARYLQDVAVLLLNKLASLEPGRRQRYLQILMSNMSQVSLDTLLADSANINIEDTSERYKHKVNFNFSNEQSAIAARENEIKERSLKDVQTFEHNKQAMLGIMLRVIQEKMNGVLHKQVDKTNSNHYKSVSTVADEAIKSGEFAIIIKEENPFKKPIVPTPLKQLISEEEYKKCTEYQQLVYKYIEQASLSQDDIDDWEQDGNQKGQPPLLNQPIVRCVCCGKQFRYFSLSIAIGQLFTRQNLLVQHLLKCMKFRLTHPIDYTKLLKRNGKAWTSHSANNIDKYIEAVTGLSIDNLPVVPVIYKHQNIIDKAAKIAAMPIDDNNTPRHEDHVPIADIYQRQGIIKLIYTLVCISLISPHSDERKNGEYDSVEYYEKLFRAKAEVNINDFREDDWEYMFDKYGASSCSTLMYIYSMRHLQKACAKGGCKSATSLFGSSHESNHVEADGAEPGSLAALTKGFDLCSTHKKKRILIVVIEFGLIRSECLIHHNIWGYKLSYDDMPSECVGKYDDLTEKRLFCDVQDTDRCKRLHRLMDEFDARVGTLTAEEVRRRVKEVTGYEPEDLSLFRDAESNSAGVYSNTEEPKEFDELNKEEKLRVLKQTEYYFERRETGGCYMCDFTTNNRARRDFGNHHAHHVKEEDKEFGPSECLKKSFKDGRKERRKCCPLCGECHIRVHNTKSYAEKFNTMFGKKYKLKKKGIIERKNR